MFSTKIKIESALYRRVAEVAKRAGYASIDEFVKHVLERELDRLEQAGSDEKVEERLRGLGYIE